MTVLVSAEDTYREVMTVDPPTSTGLLDTARRDELFGQVWARPGLGRRERRWITLVCVTWACDQAAMEEHVFAALNSGDISIEEMLEFVLHYAVYCGWPQASTAEVVIRSQWTRVQQLRGEEVRPLPVLANETLGDDDWERRLRRGEQKFADVNLVPAPPRDSPYFHAGILNFVFGHLWQRPALSRRDRRFITVACVGVEGAPIPILNHVGSALESGDVTRTEMDEAIRHFAAYADRQRATALVDASTKPWARRAAD
jgi:4-carboxymuconolactone decarboxylase